MNLPIKLCVFNFKAIIKLKEVDSVHSQGINLSEIKKTGV